MLAGALLIVAAWLYYGALAHAEVSQVTLLMRLTSVQTLLLSAVFLGEQLTPTQYKAFAAMSLGGLLVLYEPGQAGPRLNKAVAWILLATSLLALESVLSATVYQEHSLWAGIVWEKAGQILGTLALVGLTRDKRQLVRAARTGGLPLWGTLLGEQTVRLVVGVLSGVVIVQGVPLALVSALGGLRLVFTLLLAAWLLRERWPIETLPTRLGGSGCIVLGLVLMI
jgi:drug/metabolite transporter (DMT)-like permease